MKKNRLLTGGDRITPPAGVGYWKFSGNPDALREIVLNNACPISYSIKPSAVRGSQTSRRLCRLLKIVTVRCNIY